MLKKKFKRKNTKNSDKNSQFKLKKKKQKGEPSYIMLYLVEHAFEVIKLEEILL